MDTGQWCSKSVLSDLQKRANSLPPSARPESVWTGLLLRRLLYSAEHQNRKPVGDFVVCVMPNVQHFIPGETDRVWQTKRWKNELKQLERTTYFSKLWLHFSQLLSYISELLLYISQLQLINLNYDYILVSQNLLLPTTVAFFKLFIYGVSAFNMITDRKWRRERRGQDQERSTSWDSNSGRQRATALYVGTLLNEANGTDYRLYLKLSCNYFLASIFPMRQKQASIQ